MSSEHVKEQRKHTAPADPEHRELSQDHPLEEAQKHSHTILEQLTSDTEDDLQRPTQGMLLSGLAAGLDLGFGPFAVAVAVTLTEGTFSKPVQELLSANLYAVGFIFVTLGKSELFTEQTTSAILPVLARRASIAQLLRLWGLVLLANLVGGAVFALLATRLGPGLGIVTPATFIQLATPLIDKTAGVTLLSAVAAGWLMGLVAWLMSASRETISQIVVVWLTTSLIGLFKLHHSIAGSSEVLMSALSGGASAAEYARFLALAVLGNAVGGVFFVGLLKFSAVQGSTR
ncbi:MAG TPA: formate/nitrite transporter family protein [Gemmatimonadales bacterium]|nr:formate/nitrite transporter family protein [Gemmatimonadales bacterium]